MTAFYFIQPKIISLSNFDAVFAVVLPLHFVQLRRTLETAFYLTHPSSISLSSFDAVLAVVLPPHFVQLRSNI
ncbi:MAG: hypothetical protein ABS934_05075 [Psychrobacillus sp.]